MEKKKFNVQGMCQNPLSWPEEEEVASSRFFLKKI
jgi:hypothetical protein